MSDPQRSIRLQRRSTATAERAHVYQGRRVLVTGHTGFKGGWLALWLAALKAKVSGFALPPCRPSLFESIALADMISHREGDIRDFHQLAAAWRETDPEIVFHLAAQPLVRESYSDPLGTVQANVLGTAHVLELCRLSPARVAVVIVTSDKCYENRACVGSYRETDAMGGHDVYSASKGAAELLISAWRRSFAADASLVALASARAGNVIGGGDWSSYRLVPDCIRALSASEPVPIRNQNGVRPWQHVLDALSGYLLLGSKLLSEDREVRLHAADAWNFGPGPGGTRSVREVVEAIVTCWGAGEWHDEFDSFASKEATVVRLCIDKSRSRLGWRPRWDFNTAIQHTVDWYRAYYSGENMATWCRRQILEYMGECSE